MWAESGRGSEETVEEVEKARSEEAWLAMLRGVALCQRAKGNHGGTEAGDSWKITTEGLWRMDGA